MKKIVGNILAALLVVCIGCSDDDDDKVPVVKPEAEGVETIDGVDYAWVRYGGLDWMTSNWREGLPPYYSEEYDDDYYYIRINEDESTIENAYELMGNMYTFKDAVELAPAGWRLPTDEDWKKLEAALGMPAGEVNDRGWRGSVEGELLQQDGTGSALNFTLGGAVYVHGRPANLTLRKLRMYGYYWTSTTDEYNETTGIRSVYFRKIAYNSGQIERNVTRAVDLNYESTYPKHMNVRYVRDAR